MNKTAFILFTRSAAEEAQVKFANWGNSGNSGKGKQLAKGLIVQAKQLLESSGLPYFVFSSDKQVGLTFGERLSNAFQAVYNKGFDKVIAIGNDCPQLDLKTLKQAACQIQNKQLVFGPSKDGGVYLLGLDKAIFNPQILQNHAWETEHLLSEIQEWSNRKGLSSCSLKAKKDLDSLNDLRYFLSFLPKWSSLYFLFEQLLNNVFFVIQRKMILPFTGYSSLLGLRAPPY